MGKTQPLAHAAAAQVGTIGVDAEPFRAGRQQGCARFPQPGLGGGGEACGFQQAFSIEPARLGKAADDADARRLQAVETEIAELQEAFRLGVVTQVTGDQFGTGFDRLDRANQRHPRHFAGRQRSRQQQAGARVGAEVLRVLGEPRNQQDRPMPLVRRERHGAGEGKTGHGERLGRQGRLAGAMKQVDEGFETGKHARILKLPGKVGAGGTVSRQAAWHISPLARPIPCSHSTLGLLWLQGHGFGLRRWLLSHQPPVHNLPPNTACSR